MKNNSAIVKNFVSGGHQSNKKTATLYGIKSTNPGKCYFLNSLEFSNRIYWFVDLPHVLKTVKNSKKNYLFDFVIDGQKQIVKPLKVA